MSGASALIAELVQFGVAVSRNGDRLVLDGPENILTDALVEKLSALKSEILRSLEDWDSAEWQAFYYERAGIAEFDGQVSRSEAESRAYKCTIVEWLNRHHEPSTSGHCARCKQPDRSDHVVVPFGTDNHVWLHPECWPAWQEVRQSQAIVALRMLGIAPPDDFGSGQA